MSLKIILRQMLLLIKAFLKMRNYNFYKFPLKDAFYGKKAYILVNGPSLKKAFEEYDQGIHKFDENSFFVNLSPLDPHFFQIKPKHFCLSDPIFYQDFPSKKEQVRRMYDLLEEKVDWDLNLYMNFPVESDYKKLISYSRLTNPHIKFIRMNRNVCEDLIPPLRNRLYDTTWFMPEDGTIANLAIYIALIEGYKEIELYGADHSMFLELAVNQNNELCSLDTHFYEKGKPQMHVLKNCCTTEDKAFKIHEFLYIVYVMFHSHYLLKAFSDYKGAHILNCTPNSMIDVYDRKPGC